jgi:hypothetical protein
MKKYIITSILAALVTAGTALMAQDYPDEYIGLPGDNLNLYAVMNLFQESPTIEDFERNLNDANSRINNLDLNGDNMVDYITVNDYIDGNVHNIVLRVAMNRNETQDVAVFTVQKFRNGTVQIQLVGDEALYGRNYIVEPIYDNNYAGTDNPGYNGRSGITINVVADWPLVRYIYYPGYVSWHSSWYWGYYPSYWNPWRPYYWHYYYGYHYNNYRDYYRHYRRWNNIRYERYNDFYYGSIRSHSPMVDRRIREGSFRNTYSRPEMRREGENYYASTRQSNSSDRRSSDMAGRSNTNSTVQRTNDSRRQSPSVSNSSVSRTQSVQRSADTRRSVPSASTRTATRPTSVQRSSTSTQRSAPAASTRSASRPESVQRSGAPQRSAPSASTRTTSRPQSVQRSGAPQRSAPSASTRTTSRPQSVQRSGAPQRSGPAASARSTSRPQSVQRSNTSAQRSAPAASGRSSSRSESGQRSSSNNRASGSSQSSGRR